MSALPRPASDSATPASDPATPPSDPATPPSDTATAPSERVTAAAVEGWLAELKLEPIERAERDGVHSWDLLLDGERRSDVRVTLILAQQVGLLAWVHYAPQLNDSFRKSYRQLLRWNDELLFAKFALAEDERLVLVTELAAAALDRDGLGTALCRLLLICDALLDASTAWLSFGRKLPLLTGPGRNAALIERYRGRVGELGVDA
jgi:Putative bacterial sensory transduction regulator